MIFRKYVVTPKTPRMNCDLRQHIKFAIQLIPQLTSARLTCPFLFVNILYANVPSSGNIWGYLLVFWAACSDAVDDWLYAPLNVEPLLRDLTSLEECDGGLNLSGFSRTMGLDGSLVDALRC
jgi:hypothetical protein